MPQQIPQLIELVRLVRPPTPHPQPLYLAALSSLSKSILLQAETEVAANKKSAHPLAFVTCTLLHHPSLSDAFPEVFFAKMVQRTGGWGVPVFVPMHDVDGKLGTEGERRKAMGYRRTVRGDNGEDEWENTREYSTRIVGIMRVYFFILSMSASVFVPAGASQVQAGRALKLFQLPHFWSYFSRILGDERLLETAVAAQMLHGGSLVLSLGAWFDDLFTQLRWMSQGSKRVKSGESNGSNYSRSCTSHAYLVWTARPQWEPVHPERKPV